MSSFVERLEAALIPRGYERNMRRAVQTVLLYEAHRCIEDKLPSFRPFQRKVAFLNQALYLLDQCVFIPKHQRDQIMWRTNEGGDSLTPDLAWNRLKNTQRELANIVLEAARFVRPGKPHDQVCKEYIQHLYETVTGHKNHPASFHWEYTHNNVIIVYRIY